jgi:Fur family transcriptional regulator, ferric uptake regulator
VTVPQIGPPLSFTTVDDAVAALRNRGFRLSAARRLVLAVLFRADRPLSAEEVADGLDGLIPASDLASTYRNLEMLERLGVVRHVHVGHGPGLYALAGSGAPEYLVCERCSTFRLADRAAMESVREAIRNAFGWEARFAHFPLTGTCPTCLGRADPLAPPVFEEAPAELATFPF